MEPGGNDIHDSTTDLIMPTETKQGPAAEPIPCPESPDEFWPRQGNWRAGYRCNACLRTSFHEAATALDLTGFGTARRCPRETMSR